MKISTATATPPATRFSMSALPVECGMGSRVKGRPMVADSAYHTSVRIPAFLKDVVPSVRAWSPPV